VWFMCVVSKAPVSQLMRVTARQTSQPSSYSLNREAGKSLTDLVLIDTTPLRYNHSSPPPPVAHQKPPTTHSSSSPLSTANSEASAPPPSLSPSIPRSFSLSGPSPSASSSHQVLRDPFASQPLTMKPASSYSSLTSQSNLPETDQAHREQAARTIRGAAQLPSTPTPPVGAIFSVRTQLQSPMPVLAAQLNLDRIAIRADLGISSVMTRSRRFDERNISPSLPPPPRGPLQRQTQQCSVIDLTEVDGSSPASNVVDIAEKGIQPSLIGLRNVSSSVALRSAGPTSIPRSVSSIERRPRTALPTSATINLSPTSRRVIVRRQSQISLASSASSTKPVRALSPPAPPPSGPLPTLPPPTSPPPAGPLPPIPSTASPPPTAPLPQIPSAASTTSNSPSLLIRPSTSAPPAGQLPLAPFTVLTPPRGPSARIAPTTSTPHLGAFPTILRLVLSPRTRPPTLSPASPPPSGPLPPTPAEEGSVAVIEDQSNPSPALRKESGFTFQLGEPVQTSESLTKRKDPATVTQRKRGPPTPMNFQPIRLAPEMSSSPTLGTASSVLPVTANPKLSPSRMTAYSPSASTLPVLQEVPINNTELASGPVAMGEPSRSTPTAGPSRQSTIEFLGQGGDAGSIASSSGTSGSLGFRRRVRTKTPAVDLSEFRHFQHDMWYANGIVSSGRVWHTAQCQA